MNRKRLLIAGAFAFAIASIGLADKPKITSQDQLPRFNYDFKGDVTSVITSEEAYAALAPKVRADLEKLLADYDIQDPTTVQNIHGSLMNLDLLDGDFDGALKHIAAMRELEQKPAAKLLIGLLASSYIDARRAQEYPDEAAFRAAFAKAYKQKVDALPWDIVGENLKQTKGGAELANAEITIGAARENFQPGVDANGAISDSVAAALIGSRVNVNDYIPLKAERIAVLAAYIAANNVEKADIWAARDFDLSADKSLSPVVVGIWDSGIDLPIYSKLGQVDTDATGIAFDLHSNPDPNMIYPLTADEQKNYPNVRTFVKGLLDLQANVDSDQAKALRKKFSELKQEDVKPFIEGLNVLFNYVHGTHVAGIASAGNPAARLVPARITFDYHMIPETPTIEQAKKDAEAAKETVAYLKRVGARVVNMSWGGDARSIEDALEANGAGGTPEERKALARKIFEISRDALKEAMASAPEILFVVAAGNNNNDVNFDDVIPSGIDLPNILTVGAVDQAGDETSFTSYGASVDVHANGYNVESYFPGGFLEKISGTSMAAPNVANLAAKLLAIDPKLTPTEVTELIVGGAEKSPDGRRNLINPRKSLDLLKAKMGA